MANRSSIKITTGRISCFEAAYAAPQDRTCGSEGGMNFRSTMIDFHKTHMQTHTHTYIHTYGVLRSQRFLTGEDLDLVSNLHCLRRRETNSTSSDYLCCSSTQSISLYYKAETNYLLKLIYGMRRDRLCLYDERNQFFNGKEKTKTMTNKVFLILN